MMRIKKYFSFLLSIAITLSFNLYPTQAIAENLTEVYKAYNLSVFSNTCDITSSEVLESNGKFYMNIENIAKLARFELTTESDNSQNTFILRQGVRKICIQKETGDLLDYIRYVHVTGGNEHRINQITIPYLLIESKYYYECIPLLTYLGAECKTSELGGLIVTMPTYTLWETIVPDMEKYWRDTNINNDSEVEKSVNVGVSIMNDMLGDISSIPSKLGAYKDALFADDDSYMDGVYLEQALYEIFDVNVMKFESVRNHIGETNKVKNENIETLLTAADIMNDSADIAGEKTWEYTSSFLERFGYVPKESSDALKETLGDAADIEFSFLLAAIDSYNTIEHRLNYDEHTKNCFSNILNDDVLEYITSLVFDKEEFEAYKNEIKKNENESDFIKKFLNEPIKSKLSEKYGIPKWLPDGFIELIEFSNIEYSIDWKTEALEISKTLKDSEKLAENVLREKYTSATIETIMDVGAEKGLTMLVGSLPASFGMLSTSIMTDVVLKDNFEASKSQIYSYTLNEMQYDILEPLTFVSMDTVMDNNCSDLNKLEIMRDMIALYYRITIAFCQNNAKALEEFHVGKTEREQLVTYYNQVAEYLAVYLYMITNCTVSEIPDYDDIDDSVLTEEWMEQFSVNNIDNIVDSAYLKIEELKKEWGHYGEIWFQDLDFDGVNELIVSMGVYSEGYYFNGNEYIKITQQNVSENCASMDNLRLYYNTDSNSYGYYKKWGVTRWHSVCDVDYENEIFTLNTVVSGNEADEGDAETYNEWFGTNGEEISQQQYNEIYNKYVDSLIEYAYTIDPINTYEDSNMYASLNPDEKKERLKKSYESFKIGEKIGGFEEYKLSENSEKNENSLASYSDVLDMFYQNISTGWNGFHSDYGFYGIDGLSSDRISYIWYQYESNKTLSQTGYQLFDVNGDGIDELIVGVISDYDGSTSLYDIYTIYNKKLIHLASSGERDMFYIGKNHEICESGSSGAELSSNTYYHIEQGRLKAFEGYKYDGYENIENPYFYSSDPVLTKYENGDYHSEYYEFKNWKQITEHEYHNDGHSAMELNLTLFSEYTPGNTVEDVVTEQESWKNKYIEYLESTANYKHKSGQFALINLNNDEIPDIFCKYEVSGLAGGGQSIWTYVDGEVKSVSLIKVIGVNGTEYQWNGEKVNNPYTEWDNVTHYSYEEIKSQIENS